MAGSTRRPGAGLGGDRARWTPFCSDTTGVPVGSAAASLDRGLRRWRRS